MRAALLVALAACKSGTRATPAAMVDGGGVTDAGASAPADAAPRSHVAGLLDAFERARDATVRVDLSIEISREDAVAGGVQSRMIAHVQTYRLIRDGDFTASWLMMSLVKGDQPPPRAVGDLVLDLAEHGGDHTKFIAFHGLRKMRDRRPEVCELAVNLASTPDLPDVLDVVGLPENPCKAHLDPILDAVIRAMEADDFDVSHYLRTRVLVQNIPLTPDQLTRLARGARAARKTAGRYLDEYANDLVRRLERLR